MKIGIPRALLYYRFDTLWRTFFQELGFETVLSPVTDKTILDEGSRYSIDENCLSSKLFFGHIAVLEGKCDAVFVPRIANYGKEGIKILIVGHSYNLHDEYIGRPIIKNLYNLNAIPLLADAVDLDWARREYTAICKDVPWMVNRELVGAIHQYRDKIDGLILLTAFPCGPDSMLNEMIIRRVKGLPILNLLLDSQDGNAGIETRLESFVDIIRFRKEAHI